MIFNKENIKTNFSLNSSEYLIKANIQKQSAEFLCEKLIQFFDQENLDKEFNILDLGAGTGFIGDYLINKLSKAKIYELDFSEKMLQKRQNFHPQIQQIIGDIEEQKFPEKKFDIIISSFSLQWIENFEKLLKKLKKSGKDNFIFACALPNDKSFKNLNSPFQILDLPNHNDLQFLLLKENFEEIFVDNQIILQNFSNPIEALKNFKNMGTNYNFYKNNVKKFSDFGKFKKFYLNNYNKNYNFNLDWSVSYLIFKLC